MALVAVILIVVLIGNAAILAAVSVWEEATQRKRTLPLALAWSDTEDRFPDLI